MEFTSSFYSQFNPKSFSNRNYIYGNESSLSTKTNTTTLFYANSNRINNNGTNFLNGNNEGRNFYSFVNSKEKKNLKTANNNSINDKRENIKKCFPKYKRNNFNSKKYINKLNNIDNRFITQFNINNNREENEKNQLYSNNYSILNYSKNLNNEKNSSITKKTAFVLNLKSENNNNKNIEKCLSTSKRNNEQTRNKDNNKFNKRKIYNTEKHIKNKKLIRKMNSNNNNNNNFPKKQQYIIQENKELNFDSEKNKLELIKQQYIDNTINTQKTIHQVKDNFNKINTYNENILKLNDKCLKYTDLVQPDNLYKYREENNNNLKKYKPKQNINKNIKRPLTYDKHLKNRNKKNKNKIKNDINLVENKKKYLSAETIKRKEIKEKRNKKINNRVLNVLKNEYKNNKIEKCLDFYNNLLKNNEEKKQLFYDELEYKSKKLKNNRNRSSLSCPYKYEINIYEGYNNQNIDKNLHLKYIYNPGSEINQNYIYQKINEDKDKNYSINSFSYKRKNKFFLDI